MKQGLPIPQRIRDAPQLLPGLEVYYQAFLDLCTERQVGFGEGPIPSSSIDYYISQRSWFTEEDRVWMRALVRRLDIEYLKHRDSKRGKPTPGKSAPGRRSPPPRKR